MRFAVVPLILLLGACEGSFISVGDRWHSPQIEQAYVARDACLARNAATEAPVNIAADAAARSVAQACTSQTEKLVAIANRDGDSKVATNIRQNSQFRAMGYVLRARGQVSPSEVMEQAAIQASPATD